MAAPAAGWLRAGSAAAVSGFLAALALPPFDLSFVAWFALVPWFVALASTSPWRGALLGTVCGAVFAARSALWVAPSLEAGFDVHPLAAQVFTAGLLGYGALGFAAFGALAAALSRGRISRLIAWPAAWIAVEWIRSDWGGGVPWLLFGHSQHAALPVLQWAELWGVLGLGGALVFANTCWAQALSGWWSVDPARQPGALRAAAWGGAFVLAIYVGGAFWLAASAEGPVDDAIAVALVQAAVPQAERWQEVGRAQRLEQHLALTREAVAAGADLVVWSETAIDVFYDDAAQLAAEIAPALAGAAADARPQSPALLVGVPLHDKRGAVDVYTNSVVLVTREGEIAGRYDKQALLPIMERDAPLLNALPFAERVLGPLGRGDPYSAGSQLSPLDYSVDPSIALGLLICFESNLSRAARERVEHGANLLVNLSNDAFLAPAGAAQHFAHAVFRSVETRTPLVRVANRGTSAVVDATGRVSGQLDPSAPGFSLVSVAPRPGPAPGARIRTALPPCAVILVLMALVLRKRTSGAPD